MSDARSSRVVLTALKARLQSKARPTSRAQVVTGDGNIVAGGDLVVIDRRDGGEGLRSGGKIGVGKRGAVVNPPSPVDRDASTWARLGYLLRLWLWRVAERLG